MVSTLPLISKSSIPFDNPFVTVPSATITNGITVTFSVVSWNDKVYYSEGSIFFFFFFFFLLIVIRSGRLAEIRWSDCISKSQKSLCVSLFRIDSGLCIHHLFTWSNFGSLARSRYLSLFSLSFSLVSWNGKEGSLSFFVNRH